MKVQNNAYVSFKQRYAIDATDMFKASQDREFLRKVLISTGAQNHFSDFDSVSKKMIFTTDDDTIKLFEEYRKSSRQQGMDKFLYGAVEFGQNLLHEIKKPIIDIKKNYKIDKKDKNFAENLRNLVDYFSILDVKYKEGESLKIDKILFAINDYDQYSKEIKLLDESNISIGSYLNKTNKLIQKYLLDAKLFTTQDSVNLKSHLCKILKLSEIN